MSTTTQPPTKIDSDVEDRFRIGYRYVRRKNEDGTEGVEKVPLTQADLLFPQEGDHVMHIDAHTAMLLYLHMVMEEHLKARYGAKVLSDHRVDFGIEDVKPMGPDVGVYFDLPNWDTYKGTLDVVKTGATPQLVIEATSPDTRKNDLGIKIDFYARGDVPYYVVIDLQAGESGTGVQLHAFKQTPRGFVEDEPNEEGRYWLEAVGLWLGLEGDLPVLYDKRGERLGDYEETVKAGKKYLKELKKERHARKLAEERAEKAERVARRQAKERLKEHEARVLAEENTRRADEARAKAEERSRRDTDALAKAAEEIRQEREARLAIEALLREMNAKNGQKEPPQNPTN